METCLPENDPKAKVVNSKNALMQVHLKNPELAVAFWPKYDDVDSHMQEIIEALAKADVDFKFRITLGPWPNGKVLYKFYLNSTPQSELDWLISLQTFILKVLNISVKVATQFSLWLKSEMTDYLNLLGGHQLKYVEFLTNRENEIVADHVPYWHGDGNKFVGIKNYVGLGTLYAHHSATEVNPKFDDKKEVDAINFCFKVDPQFPVYQLKSKGVSLHKGGYYGTDRGEIAAIHKAPRSDSVRILLLFGFF